MIIHNSNIEYIGEQMVLHHHRNYFHLNSGCSLSLKACACVCAVTLILELVTQAAGGLAI